LSKSATRNRSREYQNLEIIGYEFSREVVVNFTSLENYTEFSDKISSRNNVEKVDTEFGLSNESEINKKLVKIACEKCTEKS
jgi:uncharacterized protein YggE